MAMDWRSDYGDRGSGSSSLCMEQGNVMVNERLGENVMPLELAMKREIAYQMKMEKLQGNPHNDFRHTPERSQGPPSVLGSSVLGKKRKSSSNNVGVMPNRKSLVYGLKPLQNQSEVIYCKVCSVPCQGTISLKQHLAGKKHAACVEAAKRSKKRAENEAEVKWAELEWEMVV
ncbi:hypothetical protein IFM89_034417 [Coptis chinensis]|uniref:U1-type domain-containing protein n=1 Tax=Coptis chinensis TaxID=261450 RepID=A0A835MBG9_9MAGN|nr:hypothetical protein IFM89_034417 [Coptis chinensis]